MNYPQLLNFLMRFRVIREAIMRAIVQPISANVELDQVARNLKAKQLVNVADALAPMTLVVHIQLVPTKTIKAGARLDWLVPVITEGGKQWRLKSVPSAKL